MWHLRLPPGSSQPPATRRVRLQTIYLTWSSVKAKTASTAGLPLTHPLLKGWREVGYPRSVGRAKGRGGKESSDAGY